MRNQIDLPRAPAAGYLIKPRPYTLNTCGWPLAITRIKIFQHISRALSRQRSYSGKLPPKNHRLSHQGSTSLQREHGV